MFEPIPDADYVYCPETSITLSSTAFVRFCHRVWEVVHTASTWGEFVDRLTEIDPKMVASMFPDGLDVFFSKETGYTREDAFGGWEELWDVDGTIGGAFPFGGAGDGLYGPYAWWDESVPDEIWDLATMSGGVPWLDADKLPAALAIIQCRGETAVEARALLEELAWLPEGGLPDFARESNPPDSDQQA